MPKMKMKKKTRRRTIFFSVPQLYINNKMV
jgi:hypothetical protein